MNALHDARDTKDSDLYRQAWLYAAAGLEQETEPNSPALISSAAGLLFDPNVIRDVFAETWSSPAVEFHRGSINSVAFSPDGKILASASDDQTIRLWNMANGELMDELKGHTAAVKSVAFSPNGKMLASSSDDQMIRLWDVSCDQLYYVYGKHWGLWRKFSEAIQFLWGLKLVNLEILAAPRVPTLYDQGGYHFVYDKKFRPLLNAPVPGQSKFEQVFEWAKQQAAEK